MKLLVTGGAGFIGSNFINFMLNKYEDIQIICLDLLTYAGNIENVRHHLNKKNFIFVKGDINDLKLLDDLFQTYHYETIINFAAETHVDNAIINSEKFIHSNINGVFTLLEITRKYNLYLHQISTDEVYGGKSIEDNSVCDINSPLKPTNPYAASKASADLLVLSYISTYKIRATISRSSNNYGKNQHFEKFIPHSISLLKRNLPIEIYGEGKEKRDYIPVEFHIYCIDKIINNFNNGQVIYNICSEKEYSSLEVANKILSLYNFPKNFIKFIPNRLGHDGHYPMKSDFSYQKYLYNIGNKENL